MEDALISFFNTNTPDLYTGAGFSYGAKRKDGTTIPLGNDLKENIIKKFYSDDIDLSNELKNKKLEEVCQMLKQTNEDEYNEYIANTFMNFQPEPYHFFLTDYKWSSIYTVNVDDIIEKIFDINNIPLSVFEKRRDTDSINSKENKLFKLHGSINCKDEGFVFSSSEYDELSNDTTDYRLMKFIITLHEKPLIVIGSELNERELDSLMYLYKRANKNLFLQNLIFINSKPTAYFRRNINNFEKWKLFEISTEEFLTFIHNNKSKLFTNYYSSIQAIKRSGCLSIDLIKKDIKDEISYKTRLYFGYSPTWEDALWGYLVSYEILDNIIKIIQLKESIFYSFYGRVYSGKSSALKYLFINLSQIKDTACIYFNNEEISILGIKRMLDTVKEKNVYLFIDDSADYYSLFEKISEIDDRLVIISMSNISLHRRKRYVLDHANTTEMDINLFKTKDINKLREKLISKGYADELNEKSLEDWNKRIGNSNDITSAIYKVTRSENFNDYYKNHFTINKIQEKAYYLILLICSILYESGISYLSQTLLYKISLKFDKDTEDKCADYIQIFKDDRIRIVSPFISKAILSNAAHKDIIDNIIKIVEAISGLVTEREKNYWKTAYEYLTQYKNLKLNLKLSLNEINTIYTTILSYYRDRSYYWLQKGLLEQDRNNYELANNHFNSALALHRTSYTILHAKARNYCKQSIGIDELSKGLFYFDEGKKIFLSLIDKYEYQQNKAYSIHSLVNERINFCKKYNIKMDSKEIKRTMYLLNNAISADQYDVVIAELKKKFLLFSKNLLTLTEINNDSYEEYVDE